MPRRYCSILVICDHAWGRYRKRGGLNKPNPRSIQGRLNNQLRLGAVVNATGCIDVPLGDGLVAVCSPQPGTAGGGWKVVTFEYERRAKKIREAD